MFKIIVDFIKGIQESDDSRKNKWLVILSAVSMAIIISIWLTSLNHVIGKKNAVEQKDEIGFWRIFRNGISIVEKQTINKTKNAISSISSEILNKRTVIIK